MHAAGGARPQPIRRWHTRLLPRRQGEAQAPVEYRQSSAGGGPTGQDLMEKLRRVQAVTDAALSRLELDELLVELLHRARELLDADTAAIMLLDPSGRELVATAAAGLEEEVRQGLRIPFGMGFNGRVAASAQPLVLDRVDDTTVVSKVLAEKHLASVVGVPMMIGGRVIGVLHIGTYTPRRFTPDDIDLLRLVADRASLATQARSSQLDRATTLALQRSLLPARPPAIAGLDVAARYVPGAEVGVGGDWYDLFELPSGHVGVTIGDVAGKGLRAAVVMGRIRSALRAYALETNDPAEVLSRLDRKVQLFEPSAMATAVYAVIDPARTTVSFSVAGHPPPVLLAYGSPGRLLDAHADLPLGAFPQAVRTSASVALPQGSALFLYTDGLVERRTRPITDGLHDLVEALDSGDADTLCARATARLLPDQPTTDDVAILAVRRRPGA
jgi:putative methionine-R-sulfoxide reductase with GAF domain